MRFPIMTEKNRHGFERFTNLSGALQESLMDMKIVDETGKAVQNYFDLPIEEGPLLGCLSEFFDLTGDFHVGCTLDKRPSSFGFYASKGDSQTREGAFSLAYRRDLKLDVFFKNRSFRNERQHRDLHALANAYNRTENCEESVGITWHGWTGELSRAFPDREPMKTGFRVAYVGLEFDGKFLMRIEGFENLRNVEDCSSFGPLYGKRSPLYQYGSDTALTELVEKYDAQGTPGALRAQRISGHDAAGLGYGVGDAMFGIIQIGGKLFPTKIDIESNSGMIIKSCSVYAPAPEKHNSAK